tara:strand:+ start:394 stop:780 length:387 start_codon:yes stop_codon:yes gene_type:complete
MAWTIPVYSKGAVDRAGKMLAGRGGNLTEHDALDTLNNWRSSHSFPLNTFQVTLRQRARQIDVEALVAQRLKRTPSIVAKLRRFENMNLSRMQDIGGARAVVKDVEAVQALKRSYLKSDGFYPVSADG